MMITRFLLFFCGFNSFLRVCEFFEVIDNISGPVIYLQKLAARSGEESTNRKKRS
jgi:hypothetical protein